VRISLDLLRTRERESALLDTCLRIQQRFVIDNTNVTAAERARYILPSRAAKFRVIGYFFEPDRKATLKRLEPPRRSEGFDHLYRVWILRPGEFAMEAWDAPSAAMDIAHRLP
jgi:hypothetical protein